MIVYVCTPDAGNCCCGDTAKGNPAIDWTAWREAWRAHPLAATAQLVATRCLGPCEAANVVLIRDGARTHWLREIGPGDVDGVLEYAMGLRLGRRAPPDGGIERHRFVPETLVERAAGDERLALETAELVQRHLLDAESAWSCGAFGAVAEFLRTDDEPAHFDLMRRLAVATDRGALSILPSREIRPIAYELPAGDDGWQHGIALCLPVADCAASRRGVITELGPDADAVRAEDRTSTLFDLGLDLLQIDACVRTSDPRTLEALRASEGRSLFEPGSGLAATLAAASPHRVFACRFGRIEVYQAIPPHDGASPDGPHTHLLPKLLAHGRPHAANVPLPAGWVPCVTMFPPNPTRDRNGDPKPFDRDEHERFARDWERFADLEQRAFKAAVVTALRSGSELPEADARATRLTRDVARRQAAAAAAAARAQLAEGV